LNCFAKKTNIYSRQNKSSFVYINVIKVYERVAEKGYKSIDMFKKSDSYYSNFEPDKARWYCELFNMTYDLEPIYYQYKLIEVYWKKMMSPG
jgi:hypothetical protein